MTLCTWLQTMSTPLDTSYTFLTVCTSFQTMSTPLDMSYNFLTVFTWFQIMSTPAVTSYTFQTVCIWFLTMSTTLETTYTFRTVCTRFQTLSTPFRNILHLPDCLYLVPNHVYSIWKPTAYMPYTFLNVSIWFQSLSTHLVMSYIFRTVCTLLEMF